RWPALARMISAISRFEGSSSTTKTFKALMPIMVTDPAPARLGRFERHHGGKGGGLAKIAIINDEPEVVTLLSRFLTVRRDAFLKRVGDSTRVIDQVIAFRPDLILVPLYRPPDLIGRPIDEVFHEIRGLAWLETLHRTPDLRDIPLVIF